MTYYDYFKDWQSLISSIIAFIAILLGANHKFKLDRKRDDQLRADEARSVLAALYGEIISLRQQAGKLAEFLGKTEINYTKKYFDTDHLRRYFSLTEPFLYKQLASKIGLIDPNIIIEIADFYRIYEEARRELFKLGDVSLIDCSEDRFIMYRCCEAVEIVEPTLRKIEAILVINSASEVDIESAKWVKEIDETMYDEINS